MYLGKISLTLFILVADGYYRAALEWALQIQAGCEMLDLSCEILNPKRNSESQITYHASNMW
jgi:hypothetical protein